MRNVVESLTTFLTRSRASSTRLAWRTASLALAMVALQAMLPTASAQPLRIPGYSSPTGYNLPVVPVKADPTVATFVDPTVDLVRPDRMAFAPRVFIAPFAELTAGPGG